MKKSFINELINFYFYKTVIKSISFLKLSLLFVLRYLKKEKILTRFWDSYRKSSNTLLQFKCEPSLNSLTYKNDNILINEFHCLLTLNKAKPNTK